MRFSRLRAIVAASGIMAGAVLIFPVTAHAEPAKLKIPVPGLPSVDVPIPTSLPNCKPPPPVRSSAAGLSGQFDGDPADTGGEPAQSIYEQYGAHPFAWAVFDPGCAGDVAQPVATIDTYVGDLLLGAASDIVALSNGVHNLVFHPTWLGMFDRFEANAVAALHDEVWAVYIGLSLAIVGVVILGKALRGTVSDAFRIAGWAVLVLGAVAFVSTYSTQIGHAADHWETASADQVSSGLAGSRNDPSAVGSLEIKAVLYPAWLNGEVGSSTSQTAAEYGPKLLDSEAYKWSQMKNGRPLSSSVTSQKHTEFLAAAAAIGKEDPAAYTQLQGQADGRVVAGGEALAGAVLTVPFRLVADLMVVLAMLVVRFEVMIFPAVMVIAVHHRYRALLLKGVVEFTFACLLNAFVLELLASIDTLFTGFALDPTNGLPEYFGIALSGVMCVLLWFGFKAFRRVGRLVTADSVVKAHHDAIDHIRGLAGKTGQVGVAAATGGAAAAVAAAAGVPGGARRRPQEREQAGDTTPPPPVRNYEGPDPVVADSSLDKQDKPPVERERGGLDDPPEPDRSAWEDTEPVADAPDLVPVEGAA